MSDLLVIQFLHLLGLIAVNQDERILVSIYVMMPYHGIISGKLTVIPEIDILRR